MSGQITQPADLIETLVALDYCAKKGRLGNCESRIETGTCCAIEIACFSNDSV